ncbi:MAG: DUF2279 domain-containing protein [Nitrospirota bacterium]
MKKILIFLIFIFLVATLRTRETLAFDYLKDLSKEEKFIALNVAVVSATFLWGLAFWDYGEYKPHFKAEKWFSKESYRGGADKFGHLYASYLISSVLSNLYSSWGYEKDDAARLGALSSFTLQALMEVGDSISRYGFSYEDVIMNGIGSFMGYLRYRYPDISRKIDVRLEYFPSKGFLEKKRLDFTTDYDGMKFLFAIKLDGFDFIFDFIKDKYLKYLELDVGYYTRGYKWETTKEKSRNIYFGIGVSISKILESFSLKKTSKIFNYYQLPYSYIPVKYDFND